MTDAEKEKTVLFDESARYEFPENIVRVTAGKGGEALLILGSEKTALVDCGMAYCADKLIENIHNVLKKRNVQFGQECSLDYILATHTHYDHIGAMAAVKTEWSEAKICAGAYATKVFSREGAIQTIQKMSNMASRLYGGTPNIQIDFEKMQVDRVLQDGDTISLGEEQIRVLETPGHTNCSVSYGLEPQRILFLSESTGVIESEISVISSTLKSFQDTIDSVEKCRAYHARQLVIPHYGIISEESQEKFWSLLKEDIDQKIDFVRIRLETQTEEEILAEFLPYFWKEERAESQPYDAYALNGKYEVKAILNYLNDRPQSDRVHEQVANAD